MFPERSDFTSGKGGAAWYTLDDGSGAPLLFQTQWPTLVKAFQLFAKGAIDTPIYAFSDNATCGQGSTLDELGAIFRLNARRTSELTADGRWGKETADALGWALCKTGQTSMAQQLSQSIRQGGPIPGDIVREVILFGQHILKSDLAASGQVAALPQNKADLGSAIGLPPDWLPPRWDTNPQEATADVGWVGQSEWKEPTPNPPSARPPVERPWPGAVQPAPPPATPPVEPAGAGIGADGIMLAAAAAAWLASSAGKRAPSGTRRRVGGAIHRTVSGRRRKRKAAAEKPKKGTRAKRKSTAERKAATPGKRAKRKRKPPEQYNQKERGAQSYGMSIANLGHPLREKKMAEHGYGKHEQTIARYWYRKEKARVKKS